MPEFVDADTISLALRVAVIRTNKLCGTNLLVGVGGRVRVQSYLNEGDLK